MNTLKKELTKKELNAYKDTAINILTTQIEMLTDIQSEILDEENQQADSEPKREGILTSETCKVFQETLKGEVHKLQNFDVVLAVVGTMKAGKSTTINAIVGREILPNRNRPMTSLPTLICHNKVQKTPKLTFNSTPINTFLADVKEALQTHIIENPSLEIVELIKFIQDNRLFSDSYNGETDIFDFLQRLNDLVRLATTLNEIADDENMLKFPYDSYKNVDALPTIDVAFKLKEDFETNGRFMLLDTAGPNEAGHEELLGLLREQLKRSSAVMIVLDYSQLNSEAEEKVKNEIEAIPTIQKSRLFALVNKFDQKNANSDNADSTKKHIFNNLLKDKINFEYIYPISAQNAYLANRMETYLLEHKEKPEFKEKTWVADFADLVLGSRAEKKYNKMDASDIEEEVEALMEDSLMSKPLSEVIVNMQKNAPYIAIQSALAGASDVFEKLHNFFNIRGHFAEKEQMTNEEIANLENTIANLETQINQLNSSSDNIKDEFPKIKLESKRKMKKKEEDRGILLNINEELNKMFSIERKKSHENLKTLDGNRLSRLSDKILKFETSTERKIKLAKLDEARELAKSNEYALVFPNEAALNKFQELVISNIADLIKDITNEYHDILSESIEETETITKGLYNNCNKLLNSLQEDFNREGIKEIKIKSINTNINKNKEALLSGFSLDAQHHRRTETRHETGITSGAKRWFGKKFNKKWGTYEVDIETHTVNKKAISDKLKVMIKERVTIPLGKEIETALSQLLENNILSINEFNCTVKNVVEEMNNAIIQEKMPDLETKKKYKKKIKSLQQSSQDSEEDWVELSDVFSVEKIKTATESNIAAV